MIEKLELQLNELKINTIKNYEINNKNDILTITINDINDKELLIRFKEIKGYSFQNFDDLNTIELKPLSPNLDFITYYKHGFAHFSEIDFSTLEELRSAIPNFAINLINSSIYIDANIIEINGENFHINYYN
jgi:hypothetical protein